ncbi:MAG: undecaprenyl-diphosphate phosphatase [Gammaproteobacteria bacterium AqS3]|nr:undecaprenyl-diphosphate phosphatase [Gammaproteobacteria bacterium AqS3]
MNELSWLEIFIIALIQGLTEFWPVSSSGHLLLAAQWLGLNDPGQSLSVAAHLGGLIAVLIYCRRDWQGQAGSLLLLARGTSLNDVQRSHLHTFFLLVIATLPLIPAGLVIGLLEEDGQLLLRDPLTTASTTLIFGVLLLLALQLNRGRLFNATDLSYGHALLIGLGQTLALIPGTSRAGAALTVLLLLGAAPQFGARFSVLMGAPAILAAVTYEALQLDIENALTFAVTALASCVTALAGIGILLSVVQRIGILPFVLYRIVLGSVLLGVLLIA